MSGKLPQIYIHYYGNLSSNTILQEMGIIKKDNWNKSYALKIRQCPNCSESNTPSSKWCVRCGMVMSYSGYTEMLQEKQTEKENELKDIRSQLEAIQNQLNSFFNGVANTKDQEQINKTAKLLYDTGILKQP